MSSGLVEKWEMNELTFHVFVMRKDIMTKTNEVVMVSMSEGNIRIFQDNTKFISIKKYKEDPIYFAINEHRLLDIELFTFNDERNILVENKITGKLFDEKNIVEMAYSYSFYFAN